MPPVGFHNFETAAGKARLQNFDSQWLPDRLQRSCTGSGRVNVLGKSVRKNRMDDVAL